jgi:hypothetical protein
MSAKGRYELNWIWQGLFVVDGAQGRSPRMVHPQYSATSLPQQELATAFRYVRFGRLRPPLARETGVRSASPSGRLPEPPAAVSPSCASNCRRSLRDDFDYLRGRYFGDMALAGLVRIILRPDVSRASGARHVVDYGPSGAKS